MNDRRIQWYLAGLLLSIISAIAALLLDDATISLMFFLPVLFFFLGWPLVGLLDRWRKVPHWYMPLLAFLFGLTLTAIIASIEMKLFSTTMWTVLIASLMAAILNMVQLLLSPIAPSPVDSEEISTVPGGSKRQVAASCFAILLILVACTIVQPLSTGELTEFYLLNEEGRASELPKYLTVGDSVNLTLGIANHEGRPVQYHVQVWLAQMGDANDPNSTQSMYYLETISVQLNDTSMPLDGKWQPQHEFDYNLTVPIDGPLRLWFFLFFDEVPDGSEELTPMADYWDDDYWNEQMRSLIEDPRSNQVLSLSIQLAVKYSAEE